MAQHRSTWLAQLGARERRYFPIDGGAGAHFLAALAQYDDRLRPVTSPRHADLLLVVAPITQKLMPVVSELARALPRPAEVLVVDVDRRQRSGTGDEARLGRRAIADYDTVDAALPAVVQRVFAPSRFVDLPPLHDEISETTVSLPGKQERELETELAVLSLGPAQPFIAGPLRLLLVCDGEQVLRAEIETGYARRGIAEAMMQADWKQAAPLASQLDPLAPLAGLLAYVRAIEQLQGWRTPARLEELRESARGIERAQNHLWWLLRFATLLSSPWLADRAADLANQLSAATESLWDPPVTPWLAPQNGAFDVDHARAAAPLLHWLAKESSRLKHQIDQDRLLRLRTAGIGKIPAEQLVMAGISGPILKASQVGAGDVRSRLLRRLEQAASDLRRAAERLAAAERPVSDHAVWDAPAGTAEVSVEGPRGALTLNLESAGGTGPAHVEWKRPSAAVLALLPELLAGQKLADAEVILASLDLAMAEADG